MKNINKNLIFSVIIGLIVVFAGASEASAFATISCDSSGNCEWHNLSGNYNDKFTNATYDITPTNPTPAQPPVPTPVPTNTLKAVTNLASNIEKTKAVLNGSVMDSPNYSVSAYFEYGRTVSLGLRTETVSLGRINSKPLSETLTNLEPNTIYYFRTIAQNSRGTVYGEIRILKTFPLVENQTPAQLPAPKPEPKPTPKPTPVAPIIISASSDISLDIKTRFENVSVGDEIKYQVVYKNLTDKTIEDVVLKIDFAQNITFQDATQGTYSLPDHALTHRIGNLESLEEGQILVAVVVGSQTKTDDVLNTKATIVYPDPISQIKENIVAYALNTVVEKTNQLAAASIFGNNGFLPDTLLEWVILVVAIFALMYFGRKFYFTKNEKAELVQA